MADQTICPVRGYELGVRNPVSLVNPSIPEFVQEHFIQLSTLFTDFDWRIRGHRGALVSTRLNKFIHDRFDDPKGDAIAYKATLLRDRYQGFFGIADFEGTVEFDRKYLFTQAAFYARGSCRFGYNRYYLHSLRADDRFCVMLVRNKDGRGIARALICRHKARTTSPVSYVVTNVYGLTYHRAVLILQTMLPKLRVVQTDYHMTVMYNNSYVPYALTSASSLREQKISVNIRQLTDPDAFSCDVCGSLQDGMSLYERRLSPSGAGICIICVGESKVKPCPTCDEYMIDPYWGKCCDNCSKKEKIINAASTTSASAVAV